MDGGSRRTVASGTTIFGPMDPVLWTVVILLAVGVVLIAGAFVAGQRSRTVASLRGLEAKVDQLLDHLGLSPAAPDLSAVRERLAAGDSIQAVAAYRRATGADLRTAKHAVDRTGADERPRL